MVIQPVGAGTLERRQETASLADVVGTILDKGVVIDIFARVSLVGIEVLRVDARVVVASIDTYLRFAEAANRLDLGTREPQGLPEAVREITEGRVTGVAADTTKALEAGLERLEKVLDPTPRRGRSPHGRQEEDP